MESWLRHATGAAALLLCASACNTLDIPPRDRVGADGAFATRLRGAPSQLSVGTASVLRGQESSEQTTHSHTCQRETIDVMVRWVEPSLSTDQAVILCNAAAHAARQPLHAAGLNDTPVRYQVTIVSDGGGIWQQPARPVRPELVVAFWFPAGDDAAALRARVVSTTAHEFHHIATAMASQRRWGAHREPEAYLAGACALLAIEGQLRREQLPGRHDPRADSLLPAAARRSGNAGNAMGQSLQAFFRGDRIQRDGEEGRALLRHCHHTIGFPAIAH
ncbi:hypothetical protein [Stenotrophomonas indicatrix]|uniref:hypothetical protein n=1 Tax=Stenotrophomonas indicatrix TaxID=2045451 RepID=UPI003207E2DE